MRKRNRQEQPRRNSAIFHVVMRGQGLREVGARHGISGMRVKQIVDRQLSKRGFTRTEVAGRHDMERARSIYKQGGLRHV